MFLFFKNKSDLVIAASLSSLALDVDRQDLLAVVHHRVVPVQSPATTKTKLQYWTQIKLMFMSLIFFLYFPMIVLTDKRLCNGYLFLKVRTMTMMKYHKLVIWFQILSVTCCRPSWLWIVLPREGFPFPWRVRRRRPSLGESVESGTETFRTRGNASYHRLRSGRDLPPRL